MLLIDRWKRLEPLGFTLVTLVSLVPFVYFRFFPSMDGASHLYNSNIINQLVIHRNELFRLFFAMNPEPVPNWTGHLIISLLRNILPAVAAEKILIILLLTATPFAFRQLIKMIAPGNFIFSWLIFPFSHSMFFFFGFFNFCIALLFCLVTLAAWLKFVKKPWNTRKILWMSLLFGLTYFSHIVIFGLLLVLISVHIAVHFFGRMKLTIKDGGLVVRRLLVNTGAVLAASALPLVLFAYFFYSRPGAMDLHFTPGDELFNFLVTVRPLITFNPSQEAIITSVMYYLMAILLVSGFIAAVARQIRNKRTNRIERNAIQRQNDIPGGTSMTSIVGTTGSDGRGGGVSPVDLQTHSLLPWWLFISAAIMLVLYFIMPDAYGSASYTNLRMALVIYLVIILLIATFRFPFWVGTISALVSVGVSFILLWVYAPTLYEMARVARSCNDAARYIPDNSVVLPVYAMDNWFTGHFVDYLAVDKPVVMVYNYECESGYFPVIWNHETRHNFHLGDAADTSRFLNFELYKGRQSIPLDFVFVVGKINPGQLPFFRVLDRILNSDFTVVYRGAHCTLYRRR